MCTCFIWWHKGVGGILEWLAYVQNFDTEGKEQEKHLI